MPRRLLTIGHSYCVALNRRLADEIARLGHADWEVTVIGPESFHADQGWMSIEPPCARSASRLEPIPVYLSSHVHGMIYGARLREYMSRPWDLVHCWEEPFILAGAQIARWTPRRTPLIFWTFQNISKRYPPPFEWLENYCLDRCSGWIAAGQSVVNTLAQRGYDRRPHRVISPGVDLEAFYPDRYAGNRICEQIGWTNRNIPVVGFLGRFVPEKGLSLLMRCLDDIHTPWRALMVGGGPMEGALRAWGERSGDRVRIMTGVRHDEVPAYLNAMDMLCAPSQTTPSWREQFGRMLIEAFACGLPVLASDSGEIPYVVANAGQIVPEGDGQAWRGAIQRLLENPGTRAEMGRAALERAHAFYGWPTIAKRHLEFFNELLGSEHILRRG